MSSIKWLPTLILRQNVYSSRKMYEFIERDFSLCLEYVALDKKHLDIYSFRIADLILRIGPEILRLFNLFLFNSVRTQSFLMMPNLKTRLMDIQIRKEKRRDSFMDYLETFSLLGGKGVKVKVKAFEKYIIPFKTEERTKNQEETVEVVFWWEDGYNALRHRVVREFEKSATLKHALFSLCGLWVLHDYIDRDWGRKRMAKSYFFEMPTDKEIPKSAILH